MTSLKERTVRSIFWSGASASSTIALHFIRLAVLAHLLPPAVFGVMSMVMLVIGFMQIFGQMGLSDAVIQRQAPTATALSSLYWVNIAFGAVVFVIVWFGTPWVAKFFHTPELNDYLPVAALSLLILPWGLLFNALLQKDLSFKTLAMIDVSSAIGNTVVAIVAAWLEQGVWALIWGQLAWAMIRTGALIGYGLRNLHRPTLLFSYSEVRPYLSFGLNRVGALSINFFNSRVDQLLIGSLLGAQALGYYSLIFNLVFQPIYRLNPIITRVAFPVLSLMQKELNRVKHSFFMMIRFLTMINAPLLIGAAAVASSAVPVLLGEVWLPAVPILQLMPLYALLRSANNAGASLILSQGRADLPMRWNIALLFIFPGAIYLAAYSHEIIVIMWTILIVQFLLFWGYYRFQIRRVIGPCLNSYLHAFYTPVALAGLMGLVVWGLGQLPLNLPVTSLLLIQVLSGVLLYLGLNFICNRDQLNGLWQLTRMKV